MRACALRKRRLPRLHSVARRNRATRRPETVTPCPASDSCSLSKALPRRLKRRTRVLNWLNFFNAVTVRQLPVEQLGRPRSLSLAKPAVLRPPTHQAGQHLLLELPGQPPLHEQVRQVLEQLRQSLLQPFDLAPLGQRLGLSRRGRPTRGSWGSAWPVPCRSLARACSTALVISFRTWKTQSWCAAAGHNSLSTLGYSDEPSVVIPLTTKRAKVQLGFEICQEGAHVVLVGILFQDAESQAAEEAVVIDYAEHAEGTVVDLVDGQVAAEASPGLVQIGGGDAVQIFFPPKASTQFSMVWRRGTKARWSRQRCQEAVR